MKIQCPKCSSDYLKDNHTIDEVRESFNSTLPTIDVFMTCKCGHQYEVGCDPVSVQSVHE